MINAQELQSECDKIKNHPFLHAIRNGNATIEQWKRYFDSRLSIGTEFEVFLESTINLCGEEGFKVLQEVVQSNLNEERGIVDGRVELARTHEQWREWFRNGIQKLFEMQDMSINFQDTQDDLLAYKDSLKKLISTKDVYSALGGLTYLELAIATEYESILNGLEIDFPDMFTAKELTYLRSHAIHDVRHFEEIFSPLCYICDTRSKLKRLKSGIDIMSTTKLEYLDRMLS